MNEQDSNIAANAICFAADMMKEQFRWASEVIAAEWTRPSALMKPRVYPDGNQWCALYGDNLQDGVAGFGDSPDAAVREFDKAWIEKLKGASHE